MLWAWIIAGGLVVLGLGAAVVGWRGRRVNDHPICRKCGFDLVGLSAPEKCPECGRSVTGPRAVRVGERRRRLGLASMGFLMLLVGCGGAGTLGWRATTNVKWIQHEPDWLLMAQADGVFGRATPSTLSELFARANNERLSSGRVHELARRALAAQADRARSWDGHWGRILWLAIQRKVVSADEKEQGLRGMLNPEVRVRTRVRSGAPVIVRVIEKGQRGLGGLTYTSDRKVAVEIISGANVCFRKEALLENPLTGLKPGFCGEVEIIPDLAPGKYRVRSEFSLRTGVWHHDREEPGVLVTCVDERDLEVVDADQAVVPHSLDDELTTSLRGLSLVVTRLTADPDRFYIEMRLSSDVPNKSPAAAFAAIVRVRNDGGTVAWIFAQTGVALPRGQHETTYMLRKNEGLPNGVIDVALVPNEAAVDADPDVEAVWDGALVFENVQLPVWGPSQPMHAAQVISPAPKNVEDLFKKEPEPATPAGKPE